MSAGLLCKVVRVCRLGLLRALVHCINNFFTFLATKDGNWTNKLGDVQLSTWLQGLYRAKVCPDVPRGCAKVAYYRALEYSTLLDKANKERTFGYLNVLMGLLCIVVNDHFTPVVEKWVQHIPHLHLNKSTTRDYNAVSDGKTSSSLSFRWSVMNFLLRTLLMPPGKSVEKSTGLNLIRQARCHRLNEMDGGKKLIQRCVFEFRKSNQHGKSLSKDHCMEKIYKRW